jgi:DNA gyrase subunit A
MKLDEGDSIVDVQICTEKHDVLLTSAGGQCIRFPVDDVRVFSGRTSMGVRGISLDDGDKVISLSILTHVDVSSEERAAYLKRASAVRRGGEGVEEAASEAEEGASGAIELGEQRYRTTRSCWSPIAASSSALTCTTSASRVARRRASSCSTRRTRSAWSRSST